MAARVTRADRSSHRPPPAIARSGSARLQAADALDATPASRSSWPPQEISQFASSILSAHNAPGADGNRPRERAMTR